MRKRLQAGGLILVFLAVTVGSALWFGRGQETSVHTRCRRIAAADSFRAAQEELRWFEQGPNPDTKLAELAGCFGRIDQHFDHFLLRHLGDANCGETLRSAFSRELHWRPELLRHWAHFWCHSAQLDPVEEILAIVDHLDRLAAEEPVRPIPWRGVLDLQAIFQLTGYAELSDRLSPDNWSSRFHRWREENATGLPAIVRPKRPLPGWREPP